MDNMNEHQSVDPDYLGDPLQSLQIIPSFEKQSIIDRFHEIVRVHGQSIAVVDSHERWTYHELNRRANQIAQCILQHNPEHEARVALAVPKSCELIACVIGILKAGCAYVPCVNNQPTERLRTILRSSGCSLMLKKAGYLDDLLDDDLDCIDIRSAYSKPDIDPSIVRSPEHLAYVLFTSGSTGKPKGVMIEDSGVIRLVCGQDYLPFGPSFHYLFMAPMSFDVSTLEIFTPLLHGAKLVVAPEGDPNTDQLKALCHAEGVQSTCLAFGLFSSLFHADEEIFKNMSVISVGGEQVDPNIIAKAQKALPAIQFVNAYGPTETTMLATTYQIPKLDKSFSEKIPIGTPLNRMDVFIVDSEQNFIHDHGVEGELCIGGVGVARGYVNQPELTDQSFVPIGLSHGESIRVYRTGDRVMYSESGQLIFLGRLDNQVKRRGYRIELSEIESVAKQCQNVETAVALSTNDGSQQIALFTSPECDDVHSVVKTHLKKYLPAYMLPDVIQSVDSFPLTRNGKIDTGSLLDLLKRGIQSGTTDQSFDGMSRTELWMVQTLQEVLQTPDVPLDKDLFSLGGHSLHAIVLCSRIRTQYRVQVPFSELYRCASVRAICNLIEGLVVDDRKARSVQSADKAGYDSSQPVELTSNQQRLWLLHKLDPGDQSYTINIQMSHPGFLNRSIFERAWKKLLDRHETLQSRVHVIGGVPHMIRDSRTESSVHWYSVDQVEWDQVVHELSSEPFDIENGPLVRCGVWEQVDATSIYVTMHHLISDAWSCKVLQRDLRELYEAELERRVADLPELQVQYSDYARSRVAQSKGSDSSSRMFWKSTLEGYECVSLPADRFRTNALSHSGDKVSVLLGKDLVQKVKQQANEQRVTPFSYLVAIFKIWLLRLTCQEDILIGTTLANRDREQTEDLIGFFMETIPIRSHLPCDSTVTEVVQTVSGNIHQAIDHRDCSFQDIVDISHAHSGITHNPLFEIFINHINVGLNTTDNEPFSFHDELIDNHTAKFDLTCYVLESKDDFQIVFNYRSDLFEPDTVRQYLHQFITLLESAIDDESQIISSLRVLKNSKIQSVEEKPLHTECENVEELTDLLHLRVLEQCQRHPNSDALVWSSHTHQLKTLSYGELATCSFGLYQRLSEANVQVGDRVAIITHSPAERAVAQLAALMAGAMFVPIDHSWPTQRINEVLSKTQPACVVAAHQFEDSLKIHGRAQYVLIPSMLIKNADDSISIEDLPVLESSSPAYMLFTSGSTGGPKGVVQSHQGVCMQMDVFARSLKLQKGDSLLQLSSPSFDSAVMDMYSTLLSGATLCVWDMAVLDVQHLDDFISKTGVTIYHSAPSVWSWYSGGEGKEHQSVHTVVFGGEPLLADEAKKVKSKFPSCAKIVNGMGMTESSLTLQFHCHPSDLDQYQGFMPIGYPVEGTKVRLLDRQSNPTTLAGEIEVESPMIASGYWDSESLRVIPFTVQNTDPSVQSPYRKLISGDLGRVNDDGSLTHIGRVDQQVQVSGCRVEIQEVEQAVRGLSSVRDVSVIALKNSSHDRYLKAFVVLNSLEQADLDGLRKIMSHQLPSYMVPSTWVQVGHIPRLGNGKVDKNALHEVRPVADDGNQNRNVLDSVGPHLETIIKIYENVLGVDHVCPHDNLFQLGGNSLKAIRIYSKLKTQLGTSVPMAALYQAPTPIELSKLVDSHTDSKNEIDRESLISLGGSPDGRPVFLFPGIGGHPIGFSPLIQYLPRKYRYLGVELPSKELVKNIGASIPQLARWIIDSYELDLKTQAPALIGYSFGGSVVYEIACQLQERGHEPNSLVLLDAHLPCGLPKKSKLGTLKTHMAELIHPSRSGRVHYIKSKMTKAKHSTGSQAVTSDQEDDHRVFKSNAKLNRHVLMSYVPTICYASKVSLIQAIQPDWLRFHDDDGVNGWSQFIDMDKAEIKVCNAHHLHLFNDPNASKIGDQISSWL